MKKFLTACTSFVFLMILLCSSVMPLVHASDAMGDMAGCSHEQSAPDTDGDSESACDHSKKVSLGVQFVRDNVQITSVTAFVVAFIQMFKAETFWTERPLDPLPPDSTLISHLRSHQTIVLRF